ncbi:MAG: sugar ABC transporter permease [Candidatus Schekmanbacteria bacterium]|nr:MAG: sugar ABC transporter permease [Candidatus Schekmanbacteria bacterium]
MKGSVLIKKEKTFAFFLLLPAFLFLAIFSIYPILYSFFLSFFKLSLWKNISVGAFVGFANYTALLRDKIALHSFLITFAFVIITTFFEILFGIVIALVMHNTFKWRGFIRAAILIPWAIPTVVSSQMWRFIFNDQYGFANFLLFGAHTDSYKAWLANPTLAFFSIAAADIWKSSSFAALIILAGLQIIPEDLYEAAKIDGASRWYQFIKITLPLLKPTILVALLFRTIDAFRVFDLVFVMTQGGPGDATNVLQFYGYKKIFAEGFVGYGSTISVIIFLIIFCLSLLYIRMLGKTLMEKRL